MVSLKHILVATDFCPMSIVALRHALGIAHRYGSTVSLLDVIDPSFYGMAGPDAIAAMTECVPRDADNLLCSLREEGLLDGLHLDFSARVGPVWTTIAEAIEETQAALLVLGTHGRSGLRKMVLGSVAEKAFRQASCPVLTIGPRALRVKAFGRESKQYLVPSDLSQESINALPYGISLAASTGGKLTLLHVLNVRTGRNRQKELLFTAQTQLNDFLKEHPEASNMVTCVAEVGDPAPTIIKTAQQNQADLIVMGLRAWAGDGQPMWRTAYDVVVQAPCPVLSMKTPAKLQRALLAS
jgi:nucleotide-binding universal stress UspA family protein